MAKPTRTNGPRRGLGVDAGGGPVIDPTANVIALNEAANRRQDDLRLETNRRIDADLQCLRTVVELRAQHAKEMALAESNRLDSIRQVDVLAVSTAAERSQAAIQALAVTTTTNAENLRNAMAATAATIAQQTASTVGIITERIAALEKSSYEGAGKSTVADPMITELLAEVKSLRESRSETGGRSSQNQYIIGLAIAIAGLVIAFGPKLFQ